MLISKRHKLGTPAWFKTMHYYSDLGNLGKQCSKGQTMMKSSVLAVAEKGLKLFWFFVCLLSVQKSASRNSFFRNTREYILKEMFFSTEKDVLVSKLDRFSLLWHSFLPFCLPAVVHGKETSHILSFLHRVTKTDKQQRIFSNVCVVSVV